MSWDSIIREVPKFKRELPIAHCPLPIGGAGCSLDVRAVGVGENRVYLCQTFCIFDPVFVTNFGG